VDRLITGIVVTGFIGLVALGAFALGKHQKNKKV
jgi:hypothetical protein